MSTKNPILVTGAAAGKGGLLAKVLLNFCAKKDLPVRALVHSDDERADELREAGYEYQRFYYWASRNI